MPQLGATFYPGGVDDFSMPEVLAPLPQRVMPEVPQNMQQGLQRLEQEATDELKRNSANQQQITKPDEDSPTSRYNSSPSDGPSSDPDVDLDLDPDFDPASDPQLVELSRNMADFPSFSPFPHVSGEHIPPSDEEKEAVLANSKDHVLHSNDPDMQICWARDVLSYVEISAEAAIRELEAARASSDREPVQRPATPKLEHDLRIDAINIVTYLADQGHPEALFIRSKWLEFGKFGRRQDKKEAYNGYVRAAKQGWGRADYRIGMLYENSNDMEKAMRHYQSGLANKDSAAAYRLGMINMLGQRGMTKDVAKGLDLIRQAADTADEDAPQGAFVYGMLIGRDLPDVVVPEGMLPYDVGLARQYIEKAAYLGFAKAQLKMGQAYELCQLGCEFMPAHSLHYYGLAARQGQPEASLGVSRWFLFGFEGAFAKNEQLAFTYAQMAARTKLATGEFAIGYYYEIGIAVEKDVREARRWYELAAEHGNQDAIARLESLSQAKTLSKADHETATLTRIKSQHGSQRGKRPERFKQLGNAMPTVSEAPVSPALPPISPQSPTFDYIGDYTNPQGRQPAYGVALPDRSKPMPYPDDHKPAPLNLSRPGSAVPYPDDDMGPNKGGQMSPYYSQNQNPNPSGGRPPAGPVADRSGSAFGIRTQSPGLPPTGQLAIPPAGMDPNRGRPGSSGSTWPSSQPGYGRQASPGPGARYDAPAGRLSPQPGPNRLTKMNPNANAGRGGPGQAMGPPPPRLGSSGGPGSRPGSGGRGAMPSGGGMGMGMGMGMKDNRPPPMDLAGRSSASPVGQPYPSPGHPGPGPGTPTMVPQQQVAPAPAPAPAPAKPMKQGPATFEQMGIPAQNKQESDCVVM